MMLCQLILDNACLFLVDCLESGYFYVFLEVGVSSVLFDGMLTGGGFIRVFLRVSFVNNVVEGLGSLFGVVVLILFMLGIGEASMWSTLGK